MGQYVPKKLGKDFSGGPVVKNPPTKAQVQSPLQEDPTCPGTAEPTRHTYSRALEPMFRN